MNYIIHFMKQLFIITAILFGIACSSFTNQDNHFKGEEKGIQFYHDFDEALKEAEKTGKPLFVDAYAVWCGPCNWMSAKTFTQENVGEYFNTHFINLKIDAEKGKGIQFAEKYKIRAYPTLFFITPKGKVLEKSEGALDGVQLLRLGENILNKYEAK